MKKPIYQESWCDSWKLSYQYDLLEVYNSQENLGYAYAYNNRYKQTIKLIKEVAKSKAKILDVAAASGNFSLFLAELGYEVTWNDLREELVDYVKMKWEKGIINYISGNVFDLDFDSYFDAVLITEVIEHVAHPDEFLQKIAQLVKPGGYVVMTTPTGEYFRNKLPRFSDCPDPSIFENIQFKPNSDGHIFLLHLDEIKTLAEKAELSIIKIDTMTNFLTSGHMKTHHLLKIIPFYIINLIENLSQKLPSFLRQKINTNTIVLMERKK
jgi:2-polyprenyl-6-hydroxyphenyl methylase/3-demethylubiquinone-9 3-methyltransferase